MKLLDKIKDLFMDEVVDDDEVELEEEEHAEYKEPEKDTLPKVMRETIKKEEKKEPKKEERVEFKIKPQDFNMETEEKVMTREQSKKFNFPFDFDEEIKKENEVTKNVDTSLKHDDIPRERNGNINVLSLEKEKTKKLEELYKKKDEEDIKPKFKASPVISPVYGVLDKNYTKEEVKEKTDDSNTMKRPSKKVDFETVRKKAFGNLADEIKDSMLCENCELYKEVKKISALSEDDLLYDMTVDDDAPKDVTIEKAYDDYEEFGVAYEPRTKRKKIVYEEEIIENKPEEDMTSLDNLINDSNQLEEPEYTKMEDKIDDEFEDKIDEVIKGPAKEEIEEVKEDVPSREDNKKSTKVDADFFELIDSMYKERVDE